jgi:hypothetical protein
VASERDPQASFARRLVIAGPEPDPPPPPTPGRRLAEGTNATGGILAGYAQALRCAAAEIAKLRYVLPTLIDLVERGAEIPATTLLAARLSLSRIEDALAMRAPFEARASLAADRDRLAAARAQLPAEGVALLARGAARTPGTIAAVGLAGAAAPLPYLDLIQASFGRHDVSGIKTRTGGAADEAGRELGARAFAFGDRIGFAGAPDLHTVAHEAAHVVQQRAGVALAGGAGASGDAYEAHADQVADAVVAGRSAEPLLDTMAGTGGGAHAAVQRKDASSGSGSKVPAEITAPAYAHQYRDEIIVEIDRHLQRVKLPRPHPRLLWKPDATPSKQLVKELRDFLHGDPGIGGKRLYDLMPGVHVGRLIDDARFVAPHTPDAYSKRDPGPPRAKTATEHAQDAIEAAKARARPLDFTGTSQPRYSGPNLGPLGTPRWYAEVGIAIANALYPAIVESLHRMAGRYLAILEANEKAKRRITTADVVTRYDLDEVLLAVLNTPDALTWIGGDSAKDNVDGKRAAGGVRLVKYEWLVGRDPRLQQWLRVTSPGNATVEDVAHTMLAERRIRVHDLDTPKRLAMHARSSPPYFWVPVLAPTVTSTTGAINDAAGLAGSAVADELALAQAPRSARAGKPDPDALRALGIQLGWLQSRLAPWGAAGNLLAGAIAFAKRRETEVASDPKKAAQWATPLAAQERAVTAIATQVSGILAELAESKLEPTDRESLPSVMPVIEVLVAYATAAGVSHLPQSLAPALVEARRLHQLMPLALAELKVGDSREAVRDQRQSQIDAGIAPDEAGKNLRGMTALAARAAALRSAAARGQKVDPAAIEQLAIDGDILALRARLTRVSIMLTSIEKRAVEQDMPWTDPNGGWTVRKANGDILKETTKLNKRAFEIESYSLKFADPKGNVEKTRAMRRDEQRKEVHGISVSFAELDKVVNLGEHFKYSMERIADQQLRDMVFKLALELGVMLLTGQFVGAGMAAARGIAMARRVATAAKLINEARSARAVFAIGEMVFQAAAATGAQAAMGNKVKAGDFAENLIGNVVSFVAMKPFEKLFASGKALEGEVSKWAKFARTSGKFVGRGVAEVGIGIAGNKLGKVIVTGDMSGVEGQEVGTQAFAFLAGRMVAKRAQAMNDRITAATNKWGTWRFAELKQKTFALARDADAAGTKIKPEAAAKLLERHHQLLIQERGIYQQAAADGDKIDGSGNAKDLAAMGSDQAEIPLRLARLTPVVGSEVFSGTHQEIVRALAIAKESGIPLDGKPDAKGVWTLKSGDRTFEVHQKGPASKPTAARVPVKPPPTPDLPHDSRARVGADNTAALAKQLGVAKVRVVDSLDNGVEIRYEKVKTRVGHDIRIVEIQVGKNALVSDVLGHAPTLKRIRQYNGLVGKLRAVWNRFFGGDPRVKNPFKEGTRGWEAFEEMRKLAFLIDSRRGWDPKQVDFKTIDAEIQFLQGRHDYYAEIIRSAEETGVIGTGAIGSPDYAKVTQEAIGKPNNYPKPPSDDYYYRHKAGSRDEFELVVKPNTNADAMKVVVTMVGNKKKYTIVENDHKTEVALISDKWKPNRVVEYMWKEDESFAAFGKMLISKGMATRDEIDAVIRAKFSGKTVRSDTFRGNVKDVFRPRLKQELATMTWEQMRDLLKPLSAGDRGNLAEVWYQANHAKGSEHHVAVKVARPEKVDPKKNGGKSPVEDRVIDLYDPATKKATEVKDIAGQIDKDQYFAYVEMMTTGMTRGGKPSKINKLEYVFTDPAGALANLQFFSKQLGNPALSKKLSVVVFVNGKPETVTTAAEATKLFVALGGKL